MLHAVGSQRQPAIYPYLFNVYPTRVFEAELLYLARHFTVVPLSRIVERFRAGDVGRSREIALTFDDGLRNNATFGYPILQRLGLPATFFVCPGLIETGRWQWPYEAAARLTRLSSAERVDLLRQLGCPNDTISEALSWMKSLNTAVRLTIDDRLRNATKTFVPTVDERDLFDTMTWQDLRSLDPEIITVGSHSMTHPILGKTDPPQLTIEIVESRRVLEQQLQRPTEYFCYPDGTYNDYALRLVRSHYRAAVSTRPGFVSATDDLHLLPRIGGGEELVHDLAWRLHRPRS